MAARTVRVRIAITGAGGPSAVSIIQRFGGSGHDLFAGDIDPYAPGLYLVPPDRRWLLRRGGDRGFVDELLERCRAARIDVLVPTVDTELLPLARRRLEFEAAGVKLLSANEKTLMRCLDKAALVEACAGVCPVPRTTVLHADTPLSDWSPPFLVKPRLGAGARGVQRIGDFAEMAGVPRDGTFVLQQYLPGIEHSVDVLCTLASEVLAAVPRSRLKIDSGIAVTGMTVHDTRLQAFASAVATALDVVYVANIQFKEDVDGIPRLLDVNARFPGTMPLTVAAGVDMPCLALDLCMGNPIPPNCGEFRDIGMVRVWREHMVDAEEIRTLEREAALR